MQSIPDLAHEIPIRNFILRFRPRSSELLSACYTEHRNLTLESFLGSRDPSGYSTIGAPVHEVHE